MLMDKYNPGSSWDSKSRPSEYQPEALPLGLLGSGVGDKLDNYSTVNSPQLMQLSALSLHHIQQSKSSCIRILRHKLAHIYSVQYSQTCFMATQCDRAQTQRLSLAIPLAGTLFLLSNWQLGYFYVNYLVQMQTDCNINSYLKLYSLFCLCLLANFVSTCFESIQPPSSHCHFVFL